MFLIGESPPIVSGVSNSGAKLVDGLTRRGHEVEVVSAPGVKRIAIGEFRVSSFAAHWPRLARTIDQYDVVNVHGVVPSMSDVFLALAHRISPIRRPPIAYSHHCSIDVEGFGWPSAMYNRMFAHLAKHADRVIVTTESYRDLLSASGRPIDVVPWGVDFERFAAPLREPTSTWPPLRVLFVGQLRTYKGLDVLVEATAGQRELLVTIAGKGPLRGRIEALIRKKGATNIRLAGYVDDETIRSMYAHHDVVVLPSTTRAEAFGQVLLEGMAAGCVPVASDLPGVSDVVRPTGVLVRPGDAIDLRDALLRLATDRNCTASLAGASQRRASTMPWEHVVDEYERILHSLVQESHSQIADLTLPLKLRPPDTALANLATRFRATWASLLLFQGRRSPQLRFAWGQFTREEILDTPPLIAQYVARTCRPLVLDQHAGPSEVSALLRRREIGSALAVPLAVPGGQAVLALSTDRACGLQPYDRRDLADLIQHLAA